MGIRLLLSLQHKTALQLLVRNSSGTLDPVCENIVNLVSSTTTAVKKYEPATAEIAKEIDDCYGRLDLTFTNTKEAFKVGLF